MVKSDLEHFKAVWEVPDPKLESLDGIFARKDWLW
jgi:hypothetical protein